MTDDLKLGLQVGYWTAQPPAGRELIELAQQVEALGFDSIWTGESWSSDAFSPLVWVAAHTVAHRGLESIRGSTALYKGAMPMAAFELSDRVARSAVFTV